MCGIALIISGIKINLSNIIPNYACVSPQFPYRSLFSEEDIKAALQRRGPDSLGSIVTCLYLKNLCDESKDYYAVQSFVQKEGAVGNGYGSGLRAKLRFIGATLQLRGVNPVVQPLSDAFGNVLVYNGEIFGGIEISSDSNDTEILGSVALVFPMKVTLRAKFVPRFQIILKTKGIITLLSLGGLAYARRIVQKLCGLVEAKSFSEQ